MRIALTGGIACGKSLVAKFLNELGVETIDADDIVHELIPDPAERKRIAAEVFGNEAKRRELEAKLHPLVKERINRRIVESSNRRIVEGTESSNRPNRRIVEEAESSNRANRRIVESSESSNRRIVESSNRANRRIVESGEGVSEEDVDRERSSTSAIRRFDESEDSTISPIAVIPLLFETHWDADYDIICCVRSARETQVVRMMETRGYTREEAEARLAAQMPVEEKAAKSHYVIDNNGSSEELKLKVAEFVNWLKEKVIVESCESCESSNRANRRIVRIVE